MEANWTGQLKYAELLSIDIGAKMWLFHHTDIQADEILR